MILRTQQQKIETAIEGKKAIIIMGPRQVGKSTLLKQIFAESADVMWLNGDDFDVRNLFENFSASKMRNLMGKAHTLVIDEAQRINEVGLKLKVITDQMPDKKLVATGSSSFDLASSVNESLAGRKREFKLFPLMFSEMSMHTNVIEEKRMLEHRMVYGYYPEVVTTPGEESLILKELADSYLYRDVLNFDSISKPDKLVTLVQALAYQAGSQVSYSELSKLVGIDAKTIEKYIDILEKSYIVFRLRSYARNHRNELKNSRKIYFWDNGIRNAVIGNFAPVAKRSPEENGILWENFIIAERMKYLSANGFYGNCWFWRTTQQHEVDFIEEVDGELHAYEFKWNKNKKAEMPKSFSNAYPEADFKLITPENYEEFLL